MPRRGPWKNLSIFTKTRRPNLSTNSVLGRFSRNWQQGRHNHLSKGLGPRRSTSADHHDDPRRIPNERGGRIPDRIWERTAENRSGKDHWRRVDSGLHRVAQPTLFRSFQGRPKLSWLPGNSSGEVKPARDGGSPGRLPVIGSWEWRRGHRRDLGGLSKGAKRLPSSGCPAPDRTLPDGSGRSVGLDGGIGSQPFFLCFPHVLLGRPAQEYLSWGGEGCSDQSLEIRIEEGIQFSIHSDCPVTPVSPLFCISAAVNRITSSGEILGPEFRLMPEEALRAVTSFAAWQNFDEKIKGPIEAGKLADFTVLAENPLKVAPEKIKDIQVTEVIIGGKQVYPNFK